MSDTQPDDGSKLVPVAQAVAIVQSGIRAADPADRQRLWVAWQDDYLPDAKAENQTVMPWDNINDVRLAPVGALKRAIVSTLNLVSDTDDRIAVFTAAADAADHIGTPNDASARRSGTRGTMVCERPGCGTTFEPKRAAARWCSPACRQAAYQLRRRVTLAGQ